MPRLLIVTRTSEPRGGADRIVVDLVRHLPRRGWDVGLGLVKGRTFNRPEAYYEIYGELPAIALDGTLGTRDSRREAIDRAIASYRPDVVLSMRVFDVYNVVQKRKLAKVPAQPRLAVGVRGYEPHYLDDMRRYRACVDLCVTSGELIAQACRDYCGIAHERAVSIGGGIPAATAPRTRRHQPGQPLRLIYAGRLEQPQKRIHDLRPLLERLSARRVRFVLEIAGAGPEEGALRESLAAWIDRGEVCLHGWVDAETLNQRLLPAADVFLHLAAWEGVTIAPREAMAQGVVPVISQFTGLFVERQFLNEVNALTFPVGDMTAAAEAIVRLTKDEPLLPRLSIAAQESQRGKYSFEGSIDAWSAAFEACLDAPAQLGEIPDTPERLSGRMSRYGLPSGWQTYLRRWLNVPVRHGDPGSEWPTASGLVTDEVCQELARFAEQAEHLELTRQKNDLARLGAEGGSTRVLDRC